MNKTTIGSTEAGTINTTYGFTSKHEVGSEAWVEEGFKFPQPNKKIQASQKELEKGFGEVAKLIVKTLPGVESHGPVLASLRATMFKAGTALTYNGALSV